MRIAIANSSRKKIGGVETYLENVIPALVDAGHQVSFWHENDQPASGVDIALPPGIPSWCADRLGGSQSLAELIRWQPDLVYANGIHDLALEEEILGIAPVFYFVHAYHGACISGTKSFHFPSVRPCNRRFGWPCLLHYYPHRCGGLNPATMWNDYRKQSRRLDHLQRCRAVLASSTHMVSEYQRYGMSVHHIPCPVAAAGDPRFVAPPAVTHASSPVAQLLFLGRLYADKGGLLLLEAVAQAASLLRRAIHLTFAGDGPDRACWENQAIQVCTDNPTLQVSFAGRVDAVERDRLLAKSDLLVVPSLWPEPFGLVGPEAGLAGVPAAAFAAGGIPDWLVDGVSGFLAPSDPPDARQFAGVICRCLDDPERYLRLRAGAYASARRFSMENHLVTLLDCFQSVLP